MSNDPILQQAFADLDSADFARRSASLRRLRGQKDARIVPKLIPLLRDANPVIRLLTAEVLGLNGDESAVRDLTETLYDEQPHIRAAAADALGQIGTRAAVPSLIDLLYDEALIVRFAAAVALALIADPRAVVDLIHVLDTEDAPLAMMAAQALRHIGTPEALAAIQHLREGEGYNFETHEAEEFIDETLRRVPRDLVKRYLEAQAKDPAVRTMTIDAFRAYLAAQDAARQTPEEAKSAEAADEDEEPRRGIPRERIDDYLDGEDALLDDVLRSETESSVPPRPTTALPPTSARREPPTTTAPVTPPSPVQFSAYFPRDVMPNVWQPLRAYVYKPGAAAAVSADAAQELGALLPSFREVVRASQSRIAEGALITATPELTGFQFNPPSAQIAFYDDWQAFEFKLRAVTAALDQASNGRITFTVEGVIIADVPLAIYVGANAPSAAPTSTVTRPIYQSIFCSYSHKDTQIVERVERAYKALGLNFLRDVLSLKSGQDWSEELLKLIDQADIFQLFWSSAAAESKAVRKEWMYALQRKRQNEGFIRPVYWEQPLPSLPPELAPIHFAYEPQLDDA